MPLSAKKQVLLGVILACVAILAVWWYQSPHGPGGRYTYGVIAASWIATSSGAGDLLLGVDRAPEQSLVGAKAVALSSGLRVSPSAALSASEAAAVQANLARAVAQKVVSAVDPGGRTIRFANLPLPGAAGWPADNWTASTTAGSSSTAASASINFLPAAG
jgi:hypothetical protein